MKTRQRRLIAGATLAVLVAVPAATAATGWIDFGWRKQRSLERQSDKLFGIGKELTATGTPDANATGSASVLLASGLEVDAVLRGDIAGPDGGRLASNADMIALWPSDTKPEWAIVCIENGAALPGVQRVKLRGSDRGKVETLLRGTIACDGIRRTPWQTIVATEEVDDGWAIEIYDPLGTDEVAFNRATGVATGTDAANVVVRPALGRFAFEGLDILPDGTVYAGDEQAPAGGAKGGGMFKFTPSVSAVGRTGLHLPANAAQSPFAAGTLRLLDVAAENNAQGGQGNEVGVGRWVGPIDPANARAENEAKGTGYYRPEDLHLDPIAMANGVVRFCWANTGRASARNFGEVMCLTDGARPDVQRFVTGNPLMNQPDNLAFQPKTGILYLIEDTPRINGASRPGDVWACLPDGKDDDLASDGCVMALSVVNSASEPTGFTFDASGKTAYLNIQHSADAPATTTVNEGTFDELLVIKGFGEPKHG